MDKHDKKSDPSDAPCWDCGRMEWEGLCPEWHESLQRRPPAVEMGDKEFAGEIIAGLAIGAIAAIWAVMALLM